MVTDGHGKGQMDTEMDTVKERRFMEWCLTETGNGVSYFGALCWFIQGGSFSGMLRFWKLLTVNNHI